MTIKSDSVFEESNPANLLYLCYTTYTSHYTTNNNHYRSATVPWRTSNERTLQFSFSSLSHCFSHREPAFSAYIDFPCEQCEIKTSIPFQWPFTSQIPNTYRDHSCKKSIKSIGLHCFLLGLFVSQHETSERRISRTRWSAFRVSTRD